jgi:tRNA nucleotidyltransferase (CCA-adding enzyme)
MTRKLARDVEIYEVGGAVRDELLGRPVADRDWVVVGATPEMMIASGYRPVGSDFPVFLHPDTHEEYALARTERKHGVGYRGFEFFASPDVTLEEDLARRDLTINAMARDHTGSIVDPFGGRDDLARGLLRHVSPAFAEDPLRVLRVARFAARFGFRVAPATRALMRRIVASGELATLSAERVWRELATGLMEATPSRMLAVLRDCGALAAVLPEVAALYAVAAGGKGPPGRSAGRRVERALDYAAHAGFALPTRYAVLAQTLGLATRDPPPAARACARLAQRLSARLKPPIDCRDAAALAARYRASVQRAAQLTPAQLLDLVVGCDALRRPQRLDWVKDAAAADACAGETGCTVTQGAVIDAARATIAAVDAGSIARAARAPRDGGATHVDAVRTAIRRARLAALRSAATARRHDTPR